MCQLNYDGKVDRSLLFMMNMLWSEYEDICLPSEVILLRLLSIQPQLLKEGTNLALVTSTQLYICLLSRLTKNEEQHPPYG